jgi:histidinol-phosphate aminotransferase
MSAAQFIRSDVQACAAYPVADARGFIKLDAMENPFGFPAHLRAELTDALNQVALNRYPRPAYEELKFKLRQTYAISASSKIIVGNGSDELIDIISKAVAKEGASILAPEPGFVMYRGCAMQARVNYVAVPLNTADFSLDMPAMRAAIEQHQPAVVYLAYPNNPTGNCFNNQDIEEILSTAPGLVVLDEAYQPFAIDTWMQRLEQYPNMIVMRTVSKWGLAGIRLGYMAGAASWMDQFEKLRPPYNVNVLTESVALFCLNHESAFTEQTEVLRGEREKMFKALSEMAQSRPGMHPFASSANFVLTRFPDSAATFAKLKADRILVKSVSAMHPSLHNCLRLTVGSPAENKALLASLVNV